MFGLMGMMANVNRGVASITISSNQTAWDLVTDGFGGSAPSQATDVTITVNGGVDIVSGATGTPAMDLRGMPEDSTITLVNNGNIYGAGGDGGDGKDGHSQQETSECNWFKSGGTAGASGGDAIIYDGTNVNLNIDNASGRIWSGGGGGGGGDSCAPLFPTCDAAGGSGGGGGAGGAASTGRKGAGGGAGEADGDRVATANPGSAGTGGPSGTGGAGGARDAAACSGNGAGGNGGDHGEAGSIGGGGGFAGGAAGLAINNDGTGTTTFDTGGVQGTDLKGTAQ